MNKIDLSKYSLEYLVAHREEVDSAIDAIRGVEIKKLREETEAKARALGIPIEEVFCVATKKAGTSVAKGKPMYQHPIDSSKTWTGKGKPPQWMKDYEALGKSRDDLLIR